MHMLVQKKLLPRESGIFSLELPRPSETKILGIMVANHVASGEIEQPRAFLLVNHSSEAEGDYNRTFLLVKTGEPYAECFYDKNVGHMITCNEHVGSFVLEGEEFHLFKPKR